jgi:flavin reductase (DIM6/NTAB) family NADH-FMN oxidoreductase RutF
MNRIPIPPEQLTARVHHLWLKQWLLLTAGDFTQGDFNAMTVGWGSLGTMWNKPFAQVVVRPTRHTYQFMERFDNFSLCAFGDQQHADLQLLGTKSGRDGDKIAETRLTPIAARRISSPVFVEASLILECRKIYADDFRPEMFLASEIENAYPERDYHRVYFGEIVAAEGDASFCWERPV